MWAHRPHAGERSLRVLRPEVAMRRVTRSRLWFRRVNALEAVDYLPPDERAAIYTETLKGPRKDLLTATPAAMALGALGASSVETIVGAIDDGRLPAFAGAAALAGALPAGEDAMCAHVVREHTPQARRALAAALGGGGGIQGVLALASLFTAATAPEVRLSAAEALLASSRRNVQVTADICIGLMVDDDPRVRAVAASLVGTVMGADARPGLMTLLRDDSWRVASAAAAALCDLPDGEAIAEEVMEGLNQSVVWERRAWSLLDAELEIRAPDPDEGGPQSAAPPADPDPPALEWVALP